METSIGFCNFSESLKVVQNKKFKKKKRSNGTGNKSGSIRSTPRFERCMVPVGVHISLISKCGYLRKNSIFSFNLYYVFKQSLDCWT